MKASVSMRIWFALMGTLLWVGMYLTGFSTIHWLLYLPPTGLISAAIIGICPVHIAISRLVNDPQKSSSHH